MMSNARPPIGTGTPRARSSRRTRSTSQPSNAYTSCRPCARNRIPRSGYLKFHQNLAAYNRALPDWPHKADQNRGRRRSEKADLGAIRVRFGSCIKIGNSDGFVLRDPSDPAGRHGSRQAEISGCIRQRWSKRYLKTRWSRALKYTDFISAFEQSPFRRRIVRG